MDKIDDLRAITEIRLLATALMSDDDAVRSKIFEFAYFTTNIGRQFFQKFSKVFEKNPNGSLHDQPREQCMIAT